MALYLPCDFCTNRKCEKSRKPTYACKEISKALGTGKAWIKKKTYSVDFKHIEESSDPLNKFQREVLRTIENFGSNIKEQIAEEAELKEAMSKVLNHKERQIINYYFFKDINSRI